MSNDTKMTVRETMYCAKCGTRLLVRTLEDNLTTPVLTRVNARSGCCNHYVAVLTEIVAPVGAFKVETYAATGRGNTLQDQLAQARRERDDMHRAHDAVHEDLLRVRAEKRVADERHCAEIALLKRKTKKKSKPSLGTNPGENPPVK